MAKIDGVDEGDEDEGAGGREESDEWEEFGNRKVVRKYDPRQPSQQEKEEHEMTHLPFRSWCKHCIMGRGREEDCFKSMEQERQVPEVHLDYMFMGDEKEEKTLAFLVARERETGAVLSTVVPRKTMGEWICRRLMAWLREMELDSVDIIVKSDTPAFHFIHAYITSSAPWHDTAALPTASSPPTPGLLPDIATHTLLLMHKCTDNDWIAQSEYTTNATPRTHPHTRAHMSTRTHTTTRVTHCAIPHAQKFRLQEGVACACRKHSSL